MKGILRLCFVVVAPLIVVGWLQSSALAQQDAANIRVAIMPITNFTPVLVAREKGWFSEEKLNVTLMTISQGAMAIEAVFSGSAEFGGSAILEPMIARGNGLDISFVAANAKIRTNPPDTSALFVRADDNIRSAKDLVGKTISAGLVNSINYIHMQEWLRRNDVDPSRVKFVEIPFPQMADALSQGRIDAVWNVEPFATFMLRSGKARILAYPYLDNMPGMDVTAFISKDSWLKANPGVAVRFKRAIDRATSFLRQATKEERDEWVAKYTGVKPEVVSAMSLPPFAVDFDIQSLQQNMELAARNKVLKPFDVKTMIWRP